MGVNQIVLVIGVSEMTLDKDFRYGKIPEGSCQKLNRPYEK
jgi:hypothetical protein